MANYYPNECSPFQAHILKVNKASDGLPANCDHKLGERSQFVGFFTNLVLRGGNIGSAEDFVTQGHD